MREVRPVALAIAILLLITSVLSACARGKEGEARPTAPPQEARTEQAPTSTSTAEAAPQPARVSAGELQMIEEWQSSQVPAYPGATRVHFETFPTQVENGGMMVFRTADTPERVIAFYRGALRALGWQELRAAADKVVAARGEAALTVNVNHEQGATAILLMLTDAP